MKLFADPSELTDASRLPSDVAEACESLPHLEDRTGADLLLSISDVPLPSDSDTLLRKHAEEGLLVQLKRFNDLQSAITTESRLFREILSMREWCPRPWLVITGLLFSANGKAVVGEVKKKKLLRNSMVRASVIGRQGMAFASVDGAVDAWRYYGGYAKFMAQGHLMDWLKRQARLLEAIAEGEVKELAPRSAQRELRRPGKVSWLAALFENIGRKTAQAVFDTLPEEAPLLQAIGYVTDFRATDIPGITEQRVLEWRELLGLEEDLDAGVYECISVRVYEYRKD